MDKSQVTRERRSIDQTTATENRVDRRAAGRSGPDRNGSGAAEGQSAPTAQRKERSLSPYSKRLALTQAMNVAR
ncbi:uncharacterized protein HMPREF1541_04607 [Cyphellophora europaea CBS 101466]|uniref:Uncharacterized protein n=1 Tax=Cyphellophora europaea (strain CBS 101466) TaxID=1220924 RepID=W2RUY6_CYPE1|nr:uncharacterized protein HMPREF1541_04607 [Cyphellophora europaea CBS 101466]ETN40331.1 hypothetical protein HMPREF1541_04607 [Cyphellophora europaea CBS 101466]